MQSVLGPRRKPAWLEQKNALWKAEVGAVASGGPEARTGQTGATHKDSHLAEKAAPGLSGPASLLSQWRAPPC